MEERGAVEQLDRIAFLLEREHAPTYRVQAFRRAHALLCGLDPAELDQRAAAGTLTELTGVGATTAAVVTEAAAGQTSAYLARLEPGAQTPVAAGGEELRERLVGDLHSHSDWSDGGSPIAAMARTAQALGHRYLALTDHSPRLTVANGLSRDRLERQLDVVAAVNAELAPFRLLTGIEVDILDTGALDQDADLLERLDVVVASVHSGLKMPTADMTPRMITAVANPNVDVLGHCTGRQVPPYGRGGKGRAESSFDAELVFEACRRFGVAVEINCRPERLDPPRRLLHLAVQTGCLFSIDTDAHAPGQLDWQPYGCARAEECGVQPDRVVNTWALADLLSWTGRAA